MNKLKKLNFKELASITGGQAILLPNIPSIASDPRFVTTVGFVDSYCTCVNGPASDTYNVFFNDDRSFQQSEIIWHRR